MKTKIIAHSKEHLQELITKEIKVNGEKCDLNHIDTYAIKDMSNLFENTKFNGEISQWNVSNVTNMQYMFSMCPFNGDISKWNISKIQYMVSMFADSAFTGDISHWNVEHVISLRYMFKNCNVENPWWAIDNNGERKHVLQKYKLMKKLEDKLVSKEQICHQKKRKI